MSLSEKKINTVHISNLIARLIFLNNQFLTVYTENLENNIKIFLLKQQISISCSSGGYKSRNKVPAEWSLVRQFFLAYKRHLLAASSHGYYSVCLERSLVSLLIIRIPML